MSINNSLRVAVAMLTTAVIVVLTLLGRSANDMYAQWRLGYLSLATDQPPLVAEVLDASGERVILSRTLPTSEPLPLPAGDYRVRITGEGRLGQSYHVSIPRGREFSLDVNLEDQTLIPTQDIERSFDILALQGQAPLMLIDDEGVTRVDATKGEEVWSLSLSQPPPLLRQLAPGFLWPWSSKQSYGPYDGYDHFDLRPQFMQSRRDVRTSVWESHRRIQAESPGAPIPFDGNLDGEEDLILATRHQACLLAVDGKSGELLWVAPRGSDLQEAADPNWPHRQREHRQSTVVGLPECAGDLDADGIADVIATFAIRSPSGPPIDPMGRVGAERWVEAISGKTGETIWRYDIPDVGFQLPPMTPVPYAFQLFTQGTGWSTAGGNSFTSGRERIRLKNNRRQFKRTGEHFYAPEPARMISLATQRNGTRKIEPQILVIGGSYLTLLDPHTGRPRDSPHDLGCRPVRSAVLTDVDGDGATELLLLEMTRAPRTMVTTDPVVRLIAWSLDPPREKWRSELESRYWTPSSPSIPPANWPLAADLDGDGAAEILAPTDPIPATGGGNLFTKFPTGWLSVLEGKSGKPRWSKKLRTLDSQVDQFAVGPDVNGDGRRDIFVATLLYQETELYLDCISGEDGKTLWWTSQRLDVHKQNFQAPLVTGITWWNVGEDGWPRLLVSVHSQENDNLRNPIVYAFSSGSGALLGSAPKLEEFHFADVDGDGLEEMFSFRPWSARDRGGALDVLRGGPPDRWRRLSVSPWNPVGDLDGDGVDDLGVIHPDQHLMTRSGRTGATLWRTRLPAPMSEQRPTVLGTRQDFDGDGIPDVLLVPQSSARHSHPWSPFHLISGRDGRRLWSADIAIRNIANPLLLAEYHDLNGDDIAEVILVTTMDYGWEETRRPHSSGDGNLWLIALSGVNGAVLWKQPLSGVTENGTLTQNSEAMLFNAGEMRASFGDLDHDGILDMLLPAEIPGEVLQFEIRAVSGKTGKTMWAYPLTASRSLTAPVTSTASVVGDADGDGRNEAIVLEFFDNSKGGLTLGEFARLRVLDGEFGKERWQWRGPRYWSFGGGHLSETELLRRPAPHLMRLAGKKESLICLNLWGQTRPVANDPMGLSSELPSHVTCIAVFDHLGNLLSHLPLLGVRDFAMFPIDANQDGGDELAVLSDPEGLRLIRPGERNETIWQAEVHDGSNSEIWGLVPGSRPKRGTPTIIVKESGRLWGADAADGTIVWTAGIPQFRLGRRSTAAEATPLIAGTQRRPGELSGSELGHLKKEVTRESPLIAFSFGDVTVVRPARWTQHDTNASWSAPASSDSPAQDRRFLRPLPWVADFDGQPGVPFSERAWSAMWMALLSLTLVFLPGVYLGKLVRHRRWSLRSLLLAPLLVSVALLALGFPAPSPGYASWGQKWLAGATAVPLWLIVTCLTSWTIRRSWNRFAGWLGLTILSSTAFGALWIAIDLTTRQDVAPYAWDGWYWLWLGAVYWCGWLLLPAIGTWCGFRAESTISSRLPARTRS